MAANSETTKRPDISRADFEFGTGGDHLGLEHAGDGNAADGGESLPQNYSSVNPTFRVT